MKFIFTCLVFFISTQISCSQTDEAIRKDFNQFEINEDEALDGNELKACQCQQYDANGDGIVSYAEFKAGRKGGKQNTVASAAGGAFAIGSKVEVAMGENWYKGTIAAVRGDYYKVQLPAEGDRVSDAWISKTKVRPAGGSTTTAPVQAAPATRSATWEAGTKVDIEYQGTWYPGYIMEVKGQQYKIHYDGYGENWDSWVTKDKLRIAGSNKQPTAAAATNAPASNATFATGNYYAGYSPGVGWSYYYFLPGNKVAWGCITGGLEYHDPSAINPKNLGTYSKDGNVLTIRWDNGTSMTGKFFPDGGFDMNGGIFVKESKVSPRLSADYSWSISVSGASAAETYQFREDGKFIIDRVSGYDHNDGRWGSETASNKKGTYNITGYTITLTFENGTVERHTIFAPEGGKNPDALGWDCGFLNKSK